MLPAPRVISIWTVGWSAPTTQHAQPVGDVVHMKPGWEVQGADVGNPTYAMSRKPLHVCWPCASTDPGSSSEEPSVDRALSAIANNFSLTFMAMTSDLS